MAKEFLYFSRVLFLLIFFQIIYLKLNYSGLTNFYAPGLVTKLKTTEPTLANIYFFWLDLSYLPALYLTLTILLFSLRDTKLTFQVPLTVLFLFFYTTGLADFFSLNSNLPFSDYSLSPDNSFLTNNLNKYHPLLFYTSVTLLTCSLILNLVRFSPNFNFQTTYHNIYFFQTRLLTLLLNSFTLILGGWWALQEWTWGGWWNWDPSETFGLGVTLSVIIATHSAIKLSETRKVVGRQNLFFLLLLFFMVVVQLNFEVLSHNFGLKFFHFFNTNFSLLFFFSSIGVTITVLRRNVLKEHNTLKTVWAQDSEKIGSYILTIFLGLLIATPLLLSFTPLLNHISWKFFNLTLLSTYSVYPTLILATVFSIFARMPQIVVQKRNFRFFFWFYQTNLLNLGFFTTLKESLSKFHLILVFGALINLLGFEKDFFSWIGYLNTQGTVLESNLLYQINSIYWGGGGLIQDFVVWKDLANSWVAKQNLHLEYTNGLIEYPLLGSNLENLVNLRFNQQSRIPIYLETGAHGVGLLTNLILMGYFLGVTLWLRRSYTRDNENF